MMLSLFLLLLKLQLLAVSAFSSSQIAKPGCQDRCGNISIPHPFGIRAGCYYNTSYEVTCNDSKPFLRQFNLEVMDLSFDPPHQTLKVGNVFQNICISDVGKTSVESIIDLRDSPYRFSTEYNIFVLEGCDVNAVLKNSSGDILSGCSSICNSSTNKSFCFGINCCQATLYQRANYYELSYYGLDFYNISLHHDGPSSSQTCNVEVGLLDSEAVNGYAGELSSMKIFPTVLEWTLADDKHSRSDNTDCNFFSGSQSCSCRDYYGYFGNPYIPNGCQLVEECQKCKHGCFNNGTDGRTQYICKKHHLLNNLASILGFSISIGSVILLLAGYWLYKLVKRIRKVRQKAKCFKRNGGLLLQQQISSRDGVVEKTRIFSLSEIEKATNDFSEIRILGQGGQGTVYKGMLVDGRTVAIKKSNKVDKNQLEQFINEMVILSLVNHRSVVKLLGCCLETEVPLLVYEFIPNGTLYQHIHDPSEEFHITWRMRLQIALESASALAYLHSSSSSPIYHRDIKSSNILLDEKYRAKVSDFGTSRAITIEQTHVTTFVQGTYGYLDPEYFQSNQFTEKSDVYSFGVVLVELITGKKPILPNGSGGWISLASEFLFQMENSHLFDILDSRISEEAKEQDLMAVASLARQCLKMKGKERPTMKEVSVLLDGIWSPQVLSNPKERECLVSSDSVVMEYNYPFSTNTSFQDNSPRASFSIEALPLMSQ